MCDELGQIVVNFKNLNCGVVRDQLGLKEGFVEFG